jgi:hypothetical protein
VIAQGGSSVSVKPEKSTLGKVGAIFTGKAVPSDFKKDASKDPVSPASGIVSPPPAGSGSENSTPGNGSLMKSFSFGGTKRKSTIGEPSPAGSNASSASKPGSTTAAANPFSENGNPFTMDEEESTPSPPAVKSMPPPPPASVVPPPPAPASAPPSGPPKVMVEALYDHDVSLCLSSLSCSPHVFWFFVFPFS